MNINSLKRFKIAKIDYFNPTLNTISAGNGTDHSFSSLEKAIEDIKKKRENSDLSFGCYAVVDFGESYTNNEKGNFVYMEYSDYNLIKVDLNEDEKIAKKGK